MKKVTYLYVLLFVTFASALTVPKALRDAWSTLSTPFYNKCMCKTGVNTTLASGYINNIKCTSDRNFKCFIKCIFTNIGLMDTFGVLQQSVWMEKVAGVTPAIYQKCNGVFCGDTDICDIAYEFYECITYMLLDYSS
ncbi:hypothetical protein FQA39_LY09520 [Lamprigera yunnana]|nr:hypothetical protein FQA39_LY09520 [Lamprigera yunnana]